MTFWYTNVTQRQKYRSICCHTILDAVKPFFRTSPLNVISVYYSYSVVVMSAGHSNMIQLPLGVTQLIPTANLKNAPAGLRAATPLSLVQVN